MTKPKRLLLTCCFAFFNCLAMAGTIVATNIAELNTANTQAKPGDTIILENGEWNNVGIVLTCSGTKEQPIIFRARTAGKVLVTGNSWLKLGGNYLVVEGLFFTRGYAGNDAVIDFRVNKNLLANNCRVTNCTVNDFNNPKRMAENNWVLFSGKNNRLDHCSFINKKNLGVLLAVQLDDDRSRGNFHSIDHNYFGRRIPLASNGGEIIRVGVSQHCQFNSNTYITDNFFEHCDGETEIVSIKSGRNEVSRNLFYECQGSVVLRHGDNNTVENNFFLGNNKEGTGGVRVINRGQRVRNNTFYKCRGVDFRSPLAIMNGVPNSPAHRYVQVTDAIISGNFFYDSAPISFCEGSDKERSLPPADVRFTKNIFYNHRDTIIYKVYDDISGFKFADNQFSQQVKQRTVPGFTKGPLVVRPPDFTPLINKYKATGANWHTQNGLPKQSAPPVVNCATAQQVYAALDNNQSIVINLTGREYVLDKPFTISSKVKFTASHMLPIDFKSARLPAVFVVMGNGNLELKSVSINGGAVETVSLIASDDAGSSDHYSFVMNNCVVGNLGAKGCQSLFYAHKSMVADSIIIRNSQFTGNQVDYIVMKAETDDKGYYNAEKIVLEWNTFTKTSGSLLNIYRGGNDESTLGPQLWVTGNRFLECGTNADAPFIQLTGVQKTRLINNKFKDCYANKTLFVYKDIVRADHLLEKNLFESSGSIEANEFVKTNENLIK